uniref:Uncharacterized protein n=1 Tax=Octopus bimaculoides TaxID=37653 RepID=A0A0L8FU50_OCTBM
MHGCILESESLSQKAKSDRFNLQLFCTCILKKKKKKVTFVSKTLNFQIRGPLSTYFKNIIIKAFKRKFQKQFKNMPILVNVIISLRINCKSRTTPSYEENS